MKNIWMINQYGSLPSTGVGGRSRHISRELVSIGYKVSLISARQSHNTRDVDVANAAPELEEFEGFQFLRIPVIRYQHAHDKKRILNWFYFSWKLLGIRKKLGEKPDVIIYSSPSLIGYLGACLLAKRYKAMLIFEVRDIWPLSIVQIGRRSPRHLFIRFLQWIEDFAYKNSDHVISNLRESSGHMIAHGMDESKFAWLPNGFSKPELDAVEPAPDAMVAAIESQPFSVAYTGAIGAANSLETLVKAASLLRDSSDIHFNIVGSGQKVPELRKIIEELELPNVHLWPPIRKSQVQAVLSLVDVCYIGLTKDPLFHYGVSPNKLFDYLYSSRPIVYAIDSGNYRPVFEAGAGLEVEPESPDAVANAIASLHKMTSGERRSMGEKGRKAAESQYEYSLIAKRLGDIIQS